MRSTHATSLAIVLLVTGCGHYASLHVAPTAGTVIAEDGERKEASLGPAGPARVAIGAAEARASAGLEDDTTAVITLLAAASPERGQKAMASASTWGDGEMTSVRFIVPAEHAGSVYRIAVPLGVASDVRKGAGEIKVERRFVVVDSQGRDRSPGGPVYGRGEDLDESFETAPLPAGAYAVRLQAGVRAEAPAPASRARIDLTLRVRIRRLEK